MNQHLRDALRAEYDLAHDTLRPDGVAAVHATVARRRRRRTGAAAAVLALALTGGAAAWRLVPRDDPNRPALTVAGSCSQPGFDGAVFLDGEVTEAQIDGVRQALIDSPEVYCLQYESREEAWERFKHQFRDAPELVAATKVDSMPVTFRFRVERTADAGQVEQRVRHLDGVSDYRCACLSVVPS